MSSYTYMTLLNDIHHKKLENEIKQCNQSVLNDAKQCIQVLVNDRHTKHTEWH